MALKIFWVVYMTTGVNMLNLNATG